MKQTTFEEFVELARRGTFVPVVKEIIADLLTPVSAFLKIAEHSDYAFLFESVEGGEQVARYSFLGKDPFLVLRARDGRTTLERSGTTTESDEAFVPALRRLMAELSVAVRAGPAALHRRRRRLHRLRRLPDLRACAQERLGRRRRPPARTTPVPTPKTMPGFMLFDTVLAFDHVKHRILIIANARITADEDLRALYQFACAKIQFLERELERGLSQAEPDERPAPEVRSNQTKEVFEAGVRTIKERIAAGDIYQAVLSQRFETDVTADPFTVYRALRHVNPSPYMYFMRMGALAIVGSSPEMLVRVEGRRVETHPIAGTRPRGTNDEEDLRLAEELKRNEKERAEHVMLVDLGRNDLGRVCEYGSVRVPQYMALERYSHVMHLVSTVDGRLAEDRDHLDALVACFPAGTVSGAPKIRAMQILSELEPTRREIYAGAVGYLDFAGNLDFCIAIRTITIRRRPRAHPGRRGNRRRLEPGGRVRRDARQGAGDAAGARHGGSGTVILLIDNYDSFTFNLAQYLGELGAPPLVRRNDELSARRCRRDAPDRIVISPGPGRPEDAGISVEVIKRFGARMPILGVCLGHQGIGIAFGGDVVRAGELMHGKTSTVHHDGAGVFRGITQPFSAGRYHSLVIAQPLPPELELAAHTEDGTVMGVRHRSLSDSRRAVSSRVRADRRGTHAAPQLPGDVMFAALIEKLQRRQDLTVEESAAAMDEIMEGRAQPAQIAGFLIALAMKGRAPLRGRRPCPHHARAVDEAVAGIPRRVRHLRHGRRSRPHLQRVDGCGTGGRGVRGEGRQARQPFGVEPVRQRGSLRSAGREHHGAAGRRRALPAGGQHRVFLRADVPSLDASCGADAEGPRRADGLQPSRPADQSCGRRPSAGRRAAAGADRARRTIARSAGLSASVGRPRRRRPR